MDVNSGAVGPVFTITPMTAEDARVILTWRYEPPYDLYNPTPESVAEDVVYLSDPTRGYFSLRDADNDLVAYICFGEEARVAGGEYRGDALDVGCGTRPDLTGRGIGSLIINTAVCFGRKQYRATRFRATIAAFNERALKASQRAGFLPVSSFERPSDGRTFVVLERAESVNSPVS